MTGRREPDLKTPEQERDLDLLGRIQARDTAALATLYDTYGSLLYAVVLRIVGSPPDAEDVMQDAWMQIWKQASKYDARRGAVGAWLLTVARSRALDRYRSLAARSRAEGAADPTSNSTPPDPAANAVQSQLTDRLRAALATLTPEQQRVLELAYFRGLSQSEIATQLGTPLGTVKSWTRQGLQRMREAVPREQWR